MVANCFNCGKDIRKRPSQAARSKSGRVYCSHSCSQSINNLDRINENHPNFKDGTGTYRARALREQGAKCSVCGYNEDVRMLDVDHINGDRSNGESQNLMVLCVWCHALKTRKVPYHCRVD